MIFIGVIAFNTYAQKLPVKYQVSEVFRMKVPSIQNDYIFPAGQGKFITISTKRRGFLVNPLIFESYFDLYDKDLKKIRTKTIKLNLGAIKGSVKGAFVKDNTLYIIRLNKNLRKRYYSFDIIKGDINTGNLSPAKEFFRINKVYTKNEVNLFVNFKSLYYQKLRYYSDVYFYEPKLILQFSKNNHYFAVIHRDFQEDNTKYFITVFNDKFEKINTKTIEENIIPNQFNINDVLVDDNNGNVFVSAKIYNSDPKHKIKFSNKSLVNSFNIYKIGKNGIKKYKIKPAKTLEKLELAENDKQLFVLGFYRDEYIKVNDVDGILRLNLDKSSLELVHENYQNFNKKIFKLKYKTKRNRSKNHEMIIRKKTVLNNGDIIVDAEDFFVPLLSKKEDRELEVRDIVGDLLTLKINNSGQILWANKIYKRQVVKPRLALHSCFSTMINDEHYLLFTDSKTKPQPKNTQFFLRDKDLQNLNGIKISTNGSLKSGVMIENTKSKFRFMPIEGTKISKNEVIIPAKDHQFIKYYKLRFYKNKH